MENSDVQPSTSSGSHGKMFFGISNQSQKIDGNMTRCYREFDIEWKNECRGFDILPSRGEYPQIFGINPII
jgi:hypothetical protein